MRALLIAVALLSACGGGGAKAEPTVPVKPASDASEPVARLDIADITILQDGRGIHVHADGKVEVVNGAERKELGTLTEDGLFTLPDGNSGQLQDDGSFTTKEGPFPFRLDDDVLVVGDKRLTIDASGVLQGGNVDLSALKLTGVTSRGTRRTALLMIGFMLLSK